MKVDELILFCFVGWGQKKNSFPIMWKNSMKLQKLVVIINVRVR